MKELPIIQSELKAPKGQRNSFGNYNYRSCEDILEALKPLLSSHHCFLTIQDDIVLIGDRFYVKATAKITNAEGKTETATAFARESLDKKGMDSAQITGATSSYARKYALNGLFCIDDTKDADATNTHDKEQKQVVCKTAKERNALINLAKQTDDAHKHIKEVYGIESVSKADDKTILELYKKHIKG